MTRPVRLLDRFSFGGRVASAIGLILVLTLVASLAAALGGRHGVPAVEWLALEPHRVARGEVWRLVSWVLVEPSPLGLLFGCLVLWWFGKDLVEVWGSGRMLSYYFGVAAVAGAGTFALSLVDPAVHASTYLGCWPVVAAMTVAWGMYFPDRSILLYFVLPVRGIVLAYGTMVVTVVYAVYAGWEGYLPHLIAMAAMMAWIFRRWIARRWNAVASARREARAQAERRAAAERRRAAVMATTRAVDELEALDGEEAAPPIPPEVEEVLGRILDEAKKSRRAKN